MTGDKKIVQHKNTEGIWAKSDYFLLKVRAKEGILGVFGLF